MTYTTFFGRYAVVTPGLGVVSASENFVPRAAHKQDVELGFVQHERKQAFSLATTPTACIETQLQNTQSPVPRRLTVSHVMSSWLL